MKINLYIFYLIIIFINRRSNETFTFFVHWLSLRLEKYAFSSVKTCNYNFYLKDLQLVFFSHAGRYNSRHPDDHKQRQSDRQSRIALA